MKTAILGGVFGLLAVVLGMLPDAVGYWRRDEGLRLVDATVSEEQGYPLVDIKLRNLGPDVSFVKRASFQVLEVVALDIPRSAPPKAEPVSWKYDVELPLEGAPYTQDMPISQRVDAGDVDRFQFALGPAAEGTSPHIIVLRIGLQHDEAKSELLTDTMLVYMPPSMWIMGYFDPANDEINVTGFSFRQLAEANTEKIAHLASIEGARSDHVRLLLQKSDKPINRFGEALTNYSQCDENVRIATDVLKPASDDFPLAREIKHKMAADHLRKASATCRGKELYSTLGIRGSSLFLSGNFEEAEEVIAVLAGIEKPQGAKEGPIKDLAPLLANCPQEDLEKLRQGMLLLEGVHVNPSNRALAEKEIRKAAASSCPELRTASEQVLADLIGQD